MVRFLTALLFLFFIATAGLAEVDYLSEALTRSRTLNLAQHPQWLALLHYQNNSLSRPESLAEGGDFFLAPQGHLDPQAELDATIRAFFDSSPKGDDQAQCRFPARFYWLRLILGLDPKRLPSEDCLLFEKWFEAINPKGVTLIFPADYLNNPASAFGHTLLRLDQESPPAKDSLLAYSSNYAADTDAENAVAYALRGILGGFAGYFSVTPYYKKVQEYNDIENRDIWEYQLALTSEEAAFLTRHLWELRKVPFRYYYFDQNCSYYILRLLDAARPSLRLAENSPYWVIPTDTIRMVVANPELFRSAGFRPSAATILHEREAQSNPQAHLIAREIADPHSAAELSKVELLSEHDRAEVLDLGFDYFNYYFAGDADEDAAASQHGYALLLQRSTLPVQSQLQIFTPALRPDQGHHTTRLALAAGAYGDHGYLEIKARPAYHDLLDPPGGYITGSQIEFLAVDARISEREGLELSSFKPLTIFSITPRTNLIRPYSWRLSSELSRLIFPAEERGFVYENRFGLGGAWNVSKTALLFALPEAATQQSGHFREGFSAGIGGTLGLLWNLDDQLGLLLASSGTRLWLDTHSSFTLKAEGRITLNRNLALRFGIEREEVYQLPANNIFVSWDLFL